MSKESYIRGFCKAAEAHGVDPEELMKMAGIVGLGAKGIKAGINAIKTLMRPSVPKPRMFGLEKAILPKPLSLEELAEKEISNIRVRPKYTTDETKKLLEKVQRCHLGEAHFYKKMDHPGYGNSLSKANDAALLRQMYGDREAATPVWEQMIRDATRRGK